MPRLFALLIALSFATGCQSKPAPEQDRPASNTTETNEKTQPSQISSSNPQHKGPVTGEVPKTEPPSTPSETTAEPEEKPANEPTSQPKEEHASSEPEQSGLSFTKLKEEYLQDADRFLEKYAGQQMEVRADVIQPVDTTDNQAPYLLELAEKEDLADEGYRSRLDGVGLTWMDLFVLAELSEKDYPQGQSLTRGQSVTVRGTYTPDENKPRVLRLTNAEVVEVGEDPAFAVTPAELSAAFTKDRKAAEEKFADQEIVLTGVVKTNFSRQAPHLILKKEGRFEVWAMRSQNLQGVASQKLKAVKAGDTVRVRGTLKTSLLDNGAIALEESYLVPQEYTAQESNAKK